MASSGATSGSLFLAENGELFLVAGRGVDIRHFGKKEGAAFSTYVFQTGSPLFIQDSRETRSGRRYALLLPVRDSNDNVIGVLALNRVNSPFGDQDIVHLTPTVTNIALLLEENALRRHRERLVLVLSEIVNLFGDTPSLSSEEEVFKRLLIAVRMFLGTPSGAFFKLSAKRPYRVFSHHFPRGLNFRTLGIPKDVLSLGSALVRLPWKDEETLLVVPLTLATSGATFVFATFSSKPLDPLDALMISVVFRLGQMHLEHLVLFRRNEKLTREKERNRLARELHDGLAQILTSIQFYLHFLKEEEDLSSSELYEKLRSLVRLGIEESRFILSELKGRPVSVYQLEQKVWEILRNFSEGSFTPHLDFAVSTPILPFRVFHGLSLILQETLSNVRKHSHAQDVWIRIHDDGKALFCVVEDNGVGFRTRDMALRPPAGHFGLSNIRERVRLLRGKVRITSSPAEGTKVWVKIPLDGV